MSLTPSRWVNHLLALVPRTFAGRRDGTAQTAAAAAGLVVAHSEYPSPALQLDFGERLVRVLLQLPLVCARVVCLRSTSGRHGRGFDKEVEESASRPTTTLSLSDIDLLVQ